MSQIHAKQTLADAFNALADEVQTLVDRRTVLEHKLRFAHEQFQYLADKYAPAAPEIAETLSKLHLPTTRESPNDEETSSVPLPARSEQASQHQLALLIRDGRRAAGQLTSSGGASKTTGSTRDTFSRTSPDETSMSTALEQDFTVEGKKGNLQCPFSNGSQNPEENVNMESQRVDGQGQSSHHEDDPICAAMEQESTSQCPVANGTTTSSKCPIRYMDKHSPEQIAHYVETHKHELPRSHEVCLRRYQRNEEQMRKLDSKYGDIVSMIEGLSQLHQPMLPEGGAEAGEAHVEGSKDGASNERVENWAHGVSVTTDPDEHPDERDDGEDRQSHFDRPLKEVRVGESPSRPWGISVPVYEPSGHEDSQPFSPPPAPVRMPNLEQTPQTPVKGPSKCPIDHTKFASFAGANPHHKPDTNAPQTPTPAKAPMESPHLQQPFPTNTHHQATKSGQPPTFIAPESIKGQAVGHQVVFNGPVFIGYPMDQALQFMNQFRGTQ